MAVEGAMILAHSLATSVENEQPLSTALANYEEWHMPRVEVIHSESRKAGALFGLTNSALAWMRNTFLPLAPEDVKTEALTKIHSEKAKYE